ncbi:HNH endonuclease [Spirosoma sordidisoli]|nr:HNH endonuclease [Spirosoma sordidisoli]
MKAITLQDNASKNPVPWLLTGYFEGEQRRLCPSFPGYSVTESGRLFTHRRKTGGAAKKLGVPTVVVDFSYEKELKRPYVDPKHPYVNYPICVNGKQRAIGIHRLLADAFFGPRQNGQVVRHLDDNPQNNHLSNLKYGTNKENAQDAIRNNKRKCNEDHHMSKLSNQDVREIRRLRHQKVTVPELKKMFGVCTATIEGVIYNRYYKDVI